MFVDGQFCCMGVGMAWFQNHDLKGEVGTWSGLQLHWNRNTHKKRGRGQLVHCTTLTHYLTYDYDLTYCPEMSAALLCFAWEGGAGPLYYTHSFM